MTSSRNCHRVTTSSRLKGGRTASPMRRDYSCPRAVVCARDFPAAGHERLACARTQPAVAPRSCPAARIRTRSWRVQNDSPHTRPPAAPASGPTASQRLANSVRVASASPDNHDGSVPAPADARALSSATGTTSMPSAPRSSCRPGENASASRTATPRPLCSVRTFSKDTDPSVRLHLEPFDSARSGLRDP